MSIRVLGQAGDVLGILELPSTILLADQEVLRRLGAHRIEVVAVKITVSSD
ncbi:hypothetical protein MKS81_006505 [Pseudomonas aeruginosa]|nr:hypothetical protein [Pseudomonas aeruginosa]